MASKASTIEEYLKEIPTERKEAFLKLREIILKNIPKGYHEEMSYGIIGYVVPHALFPDGYHCNPKLPLSFVSIASQKNFIALHHLGLYGNVTLKDWFVAEYEKNSKGKLDMGKGCIRFKKENEIPFDLIGELLKKLTVNEWVKFYTENIRPPKK